jgi:hypothetical protein
MVRERICLRFVRFTDQGDQFLVIVQLGALRQPGISGPPDIILRISTGVLSNG